MKIIKYRAIKDNYSVFEVQKWRIWFPFWVQIGVNTHSSLERAKDFITNYKNNRVVLWEE